MVDQARKTFENKQTQLLKKKVLLTSKAKIYIFLIKYDHDLSNNSVKTELWKSH